MYYAHSKSDAPKSEWQTLKEHSQNVAKRVCDFSKAWCAEDYAWNLGLLHDIGKYQKSFQDMLDGKKIKVEHSICGAKESKNYNRSSVLAEYCIAGHHSGLPDFGTEKDGADESTLCARLKRKTEDYSAYKNELPLREAQFPIKIRPSNDKQMRDKEAAFWIRMMFSCLTDADFLDTEETCKGTVERGIYSDFNECLAKLKSHTEGFDADTPVKKARRNLLEQIVSHKDEQSDIWLMNMPTGSGKTLASMRFALERAVKGNKKHIIYVIPYTSIIEQNAKVFKDIFGKENVLEHHCNFDFDSKGYTGSVSEKLKRSAENWDASMIVTTNVQFFQSIYGNRSSQLRKLHNMADSILVFDEIHMLPSAFYQPCLEAVRMLVKKYGCEAVFLTATMPDFNKWLEEFGCNGMQVRDLIDDKECFSVFKRCCLENLGTVSFEKLIDKAQEPGSSLIVVNSKKNARLVYDKLSTEKYHLSTYMTVKDRTAVINRIKDALSVNRNITVVSTSLIEAGVDLDFDTVFRETAGLDNLLQTAGRCNREGRKQGCVAYAFEFEDEKTGTRRNSLYTKRYISRMLLKKYDDIDSVEAVREYFDTLYDYSRDEMNQLNFSTALNASPQLSFNFASYADTFKMIDDAGDRSILIIYNDDEEEKELIEQLKYSGKATKRRLQKYMVSVKEYEYKELEKQRTITDIEGIACLANENYYTRETGILFDDDSNYIYG